MSKGESRETMTMTLGAYLEHYGNEAVVMACMLEDCRIRLFPQTERGVKFVRSRGWDLLMGTVDENDLWGWDGKAVSPGCALPGLQGLAASGDLVEDLGLEFWHDDEQHE